MHNFPILLTCFFSFSTYLCAMDIDEDFNLSTLHAQMQELEERILIPSNTVSYFSQEYNLINKIAESLKKPHLQEIYLITTHFSNNIVKEALVQAKENGALVKVLIDGKSLKKQREETLKNIAALDHNKIQYHIYNADNSIKKSLENRQKPQRLKANLILLEEMYQTENIHTLISSTIPLRENENTNDLHHTTFSKLEESVYHYIKKFYQNLMLAPTERVFSFNGYMVKNKTIFSNPPLQSPEINTNIEKIIASSPDHNPLLCMIELIKKSSKDNAIMISSDSLDFPPLIHELYNASIRGAHIEIIINKNKTLEHNKTYRDALKTLTKTSIWIYNEKNQRKHHAFMICSFPPLDHNVYVVEGLYNFDSSFLFHVGNLIFHKNNHTLVNQFTETFNQTLETAISLKNCLDKISST